MSFALKKNSSSQITFDKEFLEKLETSLRKLAKSNEKLKQLQKDKEVYEALWLKLKMKVKALKEEKNILMVEREILI
jgi:hypothetical protein